MSYETQMVKLAEGAIDVHGQLEEVVFLERDNDSLLVFSDGTVLPVLHQKHGYNIKKEFYAFQVAAELGGTDPFSPLAFGYKGTGPTCYATFLSIAGFQSTNVEEVIPPLKLKPDGSKVRGTLCDDGSIKWEDDSQTVSTNVKEIVEMETGGNEKANEGELDNWIEKLEFIPEEYRGELTRGLIRSLGPSERKLACICLIRGKDYFATDLDENIKVKIRFLTTETPYYFPIIATYVKVFDSSEPGVDEYFNSRDKHLKRMFEQDHTYLIIADSMYKIYFRRKINFDSVLRGDLDKIKKAFGKYGEVNGNRAAGEIPGWIPAM